MEHLEQCFDRDASLPCLRPTPRQTAPELLSCANGLCSEVTRPWGENCPSFRSVSSAMALIKGSWRRPIFASFDAVILVQKPLVECVCMAKNKMMGQGALAKW